MARRYARSRRLFPQRRHLGAQGDELFQQPLFEAGRMRQLGRVGGGLLVEGADDDADEEVQHHEGREQDEDDEEHRRIGMLGE